MFNLENAIKDWLKLFRKHKAFDDGSIREMELHLRDHIDDLTSEGHSEQKAFEIATEEFGEVPGMAKEEFRSQQKERTFIASVLMSMYKNYLKIAVRSFTKQPFFTFLNTFGLAIGMAGGLLISLYIYDELSFDKMFSDSDRIYRVNVDHRTAGEYNEYASAPGPMAGVITQDFPYVESICRFREVGSVLLRQVDAEENVKETNAVAVDTAFFEMFGLELLAGDIKTALKEPNTLIMTKMAAEKHFGVNEALGKSLLLDNEKVYVVTGIIEAMPGNSFLRDHNLFISLTSYADAEDIAWNNWIYPTFVKLAPNGRVEDLQAFLDTVKDNYLIPWAMTFIPGLTVESARASAEKTGDFMRFNTTALTDIHLYSSNRSGEFSLNSDIQNVYILSVIGFFLILMASVNFMNLSTAHSLKRAKEVGIRKTLGSNRSGLIRQFLTESVLISFLSLLLAIAISAIIIPYFNSLSGKIVTIPYTSPLFWLVLISTTLLLGILSGSYPAFFMSRFAPVKVLSRGQNKAGGGNIRNSLVVFQFAISVFLLVSTLVVFQQLKFIQNKDLGFEKDQVLVIDDIYAAGNEVEVFKNEVKRMSKVENVSLSSYLPTPSDRNGVTFFAEGAIEDGMMDSEKAVIIGKWNVDYDYVPTLNLEIIAGRNFDQRYGTDSTGLILNESSVDMLGVSLEKVIGMRLTSDFHRQDKENMEYFTVIGVVKNFHFESLRSDIKAMSLSLGGNSNKMMAKLTAGNFPQTIEGIEEIWNRMAPAQPFSYYFMDQSFNDTYKAEQQLGQIFIAFTMLSIFIACLGLFGLAAFNAERRSKEIGIRKVLGAGVSQITYRLSADFLKLVGIAIVISIPLSWYAMHTWLQDFSYRIEIGWWIFAIAALLATGISLLTVSYQSIKAAIVNPVSSLRSE